MSTCLDNDGATPLLQEVVNQNPNLPPGITVGRLNNSDIFCLDNGESRQVCYKDIPGVHRALTAFNLNDYESPNKDEKKKEVVPLTVEDMDKLVPGMWLKCLYDINDASYYEAMFLTSNAAEQMNPNVDGIIIIGHNTNTIGIEFDKHELDEGEDAQKVVPISWCMPNGYEVYEADSHVDYIVEETVDRLFHRAFKELSNNQSFNLDEKVLFSYSMHETVAKDKDGYIKKSERTTPVPAEMDISQYKTIYSALTFSHPAVQQLDDKFKLYQLYKDDPLASKVFPRSYSSYKEALVDTEEEGECIFYVKHARSTRGEDIHIKTRDELAEDYRELKKEGDYDVDEGEGDVIIQQAVTDLYTLDGYDDEIAGRRFDIRFYLLIARGKVYLHRHFSVRWSLHQYDPKETKADIQVINKQSYAKQPVPRLVFVDTPHGHEWQNSAKKRRNSRDTTSSDFAHDWLDAISDACDDASGVFNNLQALTKDDPTKYVLIGGDAMIRNDGSAILVEFNIWPDIVYYERLTKCLAGDGVCRPMVLMSSDSGRDINTDSPISEIVSTEAMSEVIKDTALIVMQIQPANEIKGFREIIARTDVDNGSISLKSLGDLFCKICRRCCASQYPIISHFFYS